MLNPPPHNRPPPLTAFRDALCSLASPEVTAVFTEPPLFPLTVGHSRGALTTRSGPFCARLPPPIKRFLTVNQTEERGGREGGREGERRGGGGGGEGGGGKRRRRKGVKEEKEEVKEEEGCCHSIASFPSASNPFPLLSSPPFFLFGQAISEAA